MFFEKNVLPKKRYVYSELFPLFKGLGRAHMGPHGPIWIRKIKKILETFAFRGAFKGPCTLP